MSSSHSNPAASNPAASNTEASDPVPPLDREEYVEQEYFFRVLRERLQENVPTQDALSQVRDEILATTKLPLAIDILRTEALHGGRLHPAMERLSHYFTPFQTFVMSAAESDTNRFDISIALLVLERLASYLGKHDDLPKPPSRSGLFIFQFESIARNRLGYDVGLRAVAQDPFFDDAWREWINRIRGNLGAVDFADLIYFRSEEAVEDVRRKSRNPEYRPDFPVLFGQGEGRIAKANRGKDPLYMFAALQRQLDYPRVPRQKGKADEKLPPAVEARLARMEKRILLLESEVKHSGIDLSEFMQKPPQFDDDGPRP